MIQLYPSLADIPGFNRLRKISSTYKVEFTAFGGFVRRLAWALDRRGASTGDVSMFEVSPFLGDIDVLHTGEPSLTSLLIRKLLGRIPFAEFFRWQLRAHADHAIYIDASKYNAIIPVNLMTLSTTSTRGVRDDWGGIRDIADRKYRFIRNGFYKQSPLFRTGRDVEFFGALMYFRVLLEANLTDDEVLTQPGLNDARAVIADTVGTADTRLLLEQHAYLRTRLRYLMAALYAVGHPDALVTHWQTFGLDRLELYLQHDNRLWLPRTRSGVLTCSSHVGGDTFRLPFDTPLWIEGPDAAARVQEILDSARERHGPQPHLGDEQEVVMISPQLPVSPGHSSSSDFGNRFSHEFVHFSVPVANEAPLITAGSSRLAIVGAVRMGERSLIFSPPSVVEYDSDFGCLRARINCAGLFQDWPSIASYHALKTAPHIQFFVVRWTP